MWLKSLFSESSDVSAMRVMAIISLFAGIGLAIAGKDADVGIFVVAAFGAKVSQKFFETKTTTEIKETDK